MAGDGKAGFGGYVPMVLVGLALFVLVGVVFIGGCAGYKSFNRYQKRADAKNQIQVAHFQAKTTRAQIAATKARAEKRVVEAHGIRKAQDLIAKTLTPLYVQHEAIQAQKFGHSGDRTYIPVGPQGVPLVANVTDPSLENPGK